MLKGIVIAASGTEQLQKTLTKEGLAWRVAEHREQADLLQAIDALKADRNEVLCLVERDREEQRSEERRVGKECL